MVDSGADKDSGGGSGEAGAEGYGTPCTTIGVGTDPACTGTYNVCAADGPNTICTKACTMGGPGGVSDPTECPMPPTTGLCTPKNFCK